MLGRKDTHTSWPFLNHWPHKYWKERDGWSNKLAGFNCLLFRYVPFDEEITIEGPVYLVSRQNEQDIESPLSEFSIIGKVILSGCIITSEFRKEVRGDFLIVKRPEI